MSDVAVQPPADVTVDVERTAPTVTVDPQPDLDVTVDTDQVLVTVGPTDPVLVAVDHTHVVVDATPPPAVAVQVGPLAGPRGEQGLQGEQGPPGDVVIADAQSYRHVQSIAAATWDITHPLGWLPAVSVTDSAGTLVEGAVVYPTASTVRITFASAFAGEAHLS